MQTDLFDKESELVKTTLNFVNLHNEKEPTNQLYLGRPEVTFDGFDFSILRDVYFPSRDGVTENRSGFVTLVIDLNYHENIIEVVDNKFDSRFGIADDLSKQYEDITGRKFSVLSQS
ncbi:MAG: hypothetical protein WDZ62_00490 [Candidatus Pacearchaeota archaeon]